MYSLYLILRHAFIDLSSREIRSYRGMSCMTTKNYELRLPSATFWIICSCEDKQSYFCEKYQNPVAGRMIKSFLTDRVAFSLPIPLRSPPPPPLPSPSTMTLTLTLTLTLGVTLTRLVLPTPPIWSNEHLDWRDLRWAKGEWGGGHNCSHYKEQAEI